MSDIASLQPIQQASPSSPGPQERGVFQGMTVEMGATQDAMGDVSFDLQGILSELEIAQQYQEGRRAIFLGQVNQLFESAKESIASQTLGDFSGVYGALFHDFLAELKSIQKKRDYDLSNIRELSKRIFDDPSVQHAAVLAAAQMENGMAEGNNMEQMLRQFAQILVEENGPAIRAGYNINSTITLFAGERVEHFRTLREVYRSVLLSDMSEEEIYDFVVHTLPTRFRFLFRPKENPDSQGGRKK
ncbi:HrpJ-like domain protein [Candidatus Xiphinematobacter sp. Idaho Grape]|uniref:HrpJ domain-containing protein n=1 Tax=Candidatus Xiphinematobacter sp. Idaho Grape TaxID=1704307 RepID=UPI000706A052|nr:HrpJ domain-containing protein [Candidatus Xiphinematobacter sp. Idaho Grape]ALJ56476.1 HrpJ-like domain protein [Candidatus Xiphinematobacter sp. Idaho Grape]